MDFSKYQNKLPYFSRKENEEGNRAYNDQEAMTNAQFRDDLFADLGISKNPKRDLLFSHAWSLGHSSGLQEVYSYASDLVDLIE